jgi:transposase
MNLIQEAIEYIESRESEEEFSYREVAKKFKVGRTTLSRRHQGTQRSNETWGRDKQLLSPQQEHELVLYIEICARRGLPPTREMIQNFASTITKCEVSQSWVTRFLHRHKDELTIKWSPRTDRDRHKADSRFKYKLYFDMLHSKMQEHDVDARNTYNMDEKGFHVGVAKRSKRVFTKASLTSNQAKAAVQDGNREWITLLACVCASGESLPPALVY